MGRRTLQAMVADGSIVSAGEDLYWLDEAAFAAAQRRRRGRVVWVLIAMMVLLVGAVVLTGSLTRGG